MSINTLKGAVALLRSRGLAHVIGECAFRVANRYSDAKFNIETSGFVDTQDLGYDNRELVHYAPLGYRAIRNALRSLPIDPRRSAFLDYGCGKGRAVAVAASLPFQRVIGVELSAALIEQCRRNIGAMRGKRAQHVDLHCVDATCYEVPPDVDVIYFFNPFRGDVLARVFARIEQSQRVLPRRIHILYFNNDHFEKLIAGHPRIRCVRRGSAYENISYGCYVLEPES
jgi:SAM-dependent methyltransferase